MASFTGNLINRAEVSGGRTAQAHAVNAELRELFSRDRARRLPLPVGDAEPRDLFYRDRARRLPLPEVDGLNRRLDKGPVIPAAFRRVIVNVVDQDGDPLEEAIWILSAGAFPTAARVVDGTAFMWLLSIEYTTFQVLGLSGRKGVNYVWYQAQEGNIAPTDREATLVFEKKELKGFDAGQGVNMGGNLNA